jgi:hypothetical protein
MMSANGDTTALGRQKRVVDPNVLKRQLLELNPNRRVANKGGSVRGIFQMQKRDSDIQYPN